jgi:murein DD-endopeptidase MepM/ murein hydrolase activator NlpD
LRVPRGRRAIGLGLLVPGLLLMSHHGAADAQNRAATAPAKKAASKTAPPAKHKTKSRAQSGPVHHPTGQTVHVVRSGDSISRIAVRYKITRKSLIDANKLEHSAQLRLGQRLVVPGAHSTADGHPAQRVDEGVVDGDVLLVRAGPRRVPTKLYILPPKSDGQASDFMWPVDGRIISPFGRRHSGWHAGMDIKAEMGTPILAAAPGVVISSGQERAYGRIIRIEHDDGYITVYAHNLENLVEVGDRVSSGTIIGTVGRSGWASAPHLHFEVRYEGIAYNPQYMLPPRDVIEEAPDMPSETVRAHDVDDEPDE